MQGALGRPGRLPPRLGCGAGGLQQQNKPKAFFMMRASQHSKARRVKGRVGASWSSEAAELAFQRGISPRPASRESLRPCARPALCFLRLCLAPSVGACGTWPPRAGASPLGHALCLDYTRHDMLWNDISEGSRTARPPAPPPAPPPRPRHSPPHQTRCRQHPPHSPTLWPTVNACHLHCGAMQHNATAWQHMPTAADRASMVSCRQAGRSSGQCDCRRHRGAGKQRP